MAIEVVLYKNDDVSEEITLAGIENRSDYDIIRKNLFCAFEGCNSKIEYVTKFFAESSHHHYKFFNEFINTCGCNFLIKWGFYVQRSYSC